jgi:hypothetical protein
MINRRSVPALHRACLHLIHEPEQRKPDGILHPKPLKTNMTDGLEEVASGGRWERPELHRLLDHLHEGDTIVVWRLDRLSRSLKDVLHLMERIAKAGGGFRSLTESVDTTTPAGRMMMHMVGAFAEFECDMIRERTREGLESARAEGRIGGRPPKFSVAQRAAAVEDVMSGRRTVADTARLWNVSPTTGMVGAARHPVAPTEKVVERQVKSPIPAIRPARAKSRALPPGRRN